LEISRLTHLWVSPEARSISAGERLLDRMRLGGRSPRIREYTLLRVWNNNNTTTSSHQHREHNTPSEK
jgi:ribosomal protein S18 acetylase RimI-like enzyme